MVCDSIQHKKKTGNNNKKILDRKTIQIGQIQILWDAISFIAKFQFNEQALSDGQRTKN